MIFLRSLLMIFYQLVLLLLKVYQRRQLIDVRDSERTIMLVSERYRHRARARINECRLNVIVSTRKSLQTSIQSVRPRACLTLAKTSVRMILMMTNSIYYRNKTQQQLIKMKPHRIKMSPPRNNASERPLTRRR